jgi:hypothetical protein
VTELGDKADKVGKDDNFRIKRYLEAKDRSEHP